MPTRVVRGASDIWAQRETQHRRAEMGLWGGSVCQREKCENQHSAVAVRLKEAARCSVGFVERVHVTVRGFLSALHQHEVIGKSSTYILQYPSFKKTKEAPIIKTAMLIGSHSSINSTCKRRNVWIRLFFFCSAKLLSDRLWMKFSQHWWETATSVENLLE